MAGMSRDIYCLKLMPKFGECDSTRFLYSTTMYQVLVMHFFWIWWGQHICLQVFWSAVKCHRRTTPGNITTYCFSMLVSIIVNNTLKLVTSTAVAADASWLLRNRSSKVYVEVLHVEGGSSGSNNKYAKTCMLTVPFFQFISMLY